MSCPPQGARAVRRRAEEGLLQPREGRVDLLRAHEQHPADADPAREDVPGDGRTGVGGGRRRGAQPAAGQAVQGPRRPGPRLRRQLQGDFASFSFSPLFVVTVLTVFVAVQDRVDISVIAMGKLLFEVKGGGHGQGGGRGGLLQSESAILTYNRKVTKVVGFSVTPFIDIWDWEYAK